MLIYVQYLRGIAALLVVYFHTSLQINQMMLTDKLPTFGEQGVDLFFVVSGFIIFYITNSKSYTPLGFIRDRFIRVVPLYWFYSLIILFTLLVKPEILNSTALEIPHLLSSFLFIPYFHPVFSEEIWPLLIPGWTLNYEMYFYVLFTFTLLVNKKWRLPCISLLMLAPLLLGHQGESAALLFYSNSIILEFLFGILVAFAVNKGWLAGRFSLFVLLASSVALVIGVEHSSRAIHYGIASALLLWALISINLSSTQLRLFPALKLLGDSSYSLYLCHIFVIAGVKFLAINLFNDSNIQAVFLFFTAIIASVLCGIISFYLIERPLLTYFKNRKKIQDKATYVYFFPAESKENQYLTLNLKVWSDIVSSCAPLQINLIKLFKSLFANRQSQQIAVLNWYEERPCFGRFPLISFVSSVLSLLLLKLFKVRLVWVRHNFTPHSKRSIFYYSTLCKLLKFLSNEIVTHRPVNGWQSQFVPHPLYFSSAQGHLIERDIDYLYFGSVKRYKGLVELLNHWPSSKKLMILGYCGEQQLTDELNQIIQSKALDVVWLNQFVEDSELRHFLTRTKVVILPHADNAMIVSGSFFYALSGGSNILLKEGDFFNEYANKFNFVKAFKADYSDLDVHLNSVSKLTYSEVVEQAEEECGEKALIQYWQRLFLGCKELQNG